MSTVLHVSDVHFGNPAVPEQLAAVRAMIQDQRFDVVAVSGDLSQQAEPDEMRGAKVLLDAAERMSRLIVIPGNHDVMWWRSPLGIAGQAILYRNYRATIQTNLEPVLRIPGATFVGLNTAHGVIPQTLTWNVRDIGIIGYLTRHQLDWARRQFSESPPSDYRVVVMHHNLVRGQISHRLGLKNTDMVLDAFADAGVDLVLCGHDHQEAATLVDHAGKRTVVSTAGTISRRTRGKRPSAVNILTLHPDEIEMQHAIWSAASGTFVPGPSQRFVR